MFFNFSDNQPARSRFKGAMLLFAGLLLAVFALVSQGAQAAPPGEGSAPKIEPQKPSFFYLGLGHLPDYDPAEYNRPFYVSPDGRKVYGEYLTKDKKTHYFLWESGAEVKEISSPALPPNLVEEGYYASYLAYYKSPKGAQAIKAMGGEVRGTSSDIKTLLGGKYMGTEYGEHPYIWRKTTGLFDLEHYLIRKMGLGSAIKAFHGIPIDRLGRACAISDDGKTIAGTTDGGKNGPDDVWIIHDPKGFAGQMPIMQRPRTSPLSHQTEKADGPDPVVPSDATGSTARNLAEIKGNTLEAYERVLGKPRLLGEESFWQPRYYKVPGAARVILFVQPGEGDAAPTVVAVEVQFAKKEVQSWEQALTRIGFSTEGVKPRRIEKNAAPTMYAGEPVKSICVFLTGVLGTSSAQWFGAGLPRADRALPANISNVKISIPSADERTGAIDSENHRLYFLPK